MSLPVAELLPSAAAVAFSPFPIIAVVVVLSAPKAQRNGVAFAAGWLVGLAALSVVVVLVAGGATTDQQGSAVLAWVRIALAAALLGLAVRKWVGRPAADDEPVVPGWMASLDELSVRKSAGIGMALGGANPKNVALTIAAVAAVGDLGSTAARGVAVAAYVALGSSTVVGAVLAHLVLGERAASPLAALKRFMLHNHTLIMVIVLVLLAAMIGSEGLSELRG